MANDITGNPWRLDTAGVVSTGYISVSSIIYKPAAISQDVIVHDSSGKVVIDWDAPSDIGLTPQIGFSFSGGIRIHGIDVNTIDGGVLYIYLAT